MSDTWDVVSIGLGSETVSGQSEPGHPSPRPCVLDRLDAALAAVRPSRVLACYGMNDGIYHPPSPERRAAYVRGLTTLRDRVRAAGATLILITPPVFDALPLQARLAKPGATNFGYQAPYAEYNAVLTQFADEALQLRGPGVDVIDLHREMLAALTERRRTDPAFSFSADGVHPGALGHLTMQRQAALPELKHRAQHRIAGRISRQGLGRQQVEGRQHRLRRGVVGLIQHGHATQLQPPVAAARHLHRQVAQGGGRHPQL
jgi:lysophospholipase L1-like esterase